MDITQRTTQFHFPLRKMKPRPFLSSGNLKRSKSLHCSGSNGPGPGNDKPLVNGGSGCTAITGLPAKSSGFSSGPVYGRPYTTRRHHSTNDYEDNDNDYNDNDDEFVQPLPLASSSHNLYYQFQNMPVPSPKMLQSPKYMARSSLPTIGNERLVQMTSIRKKSHPEMFCFPDPENDSTGSDETPIWCDDFVLDQLADDNGSIHAGSAAHSRRQSSVSSSSGPSSPKKSSEQKCRFYIIRQRNYPPLYLENGGRIRRRIYRILVLGYPSSGKSSLIEQFYNVLNDDYDGTNHFEPSVAEQLNERRNLLVHFLETDSFDRYLLQAPVTDYQPDVYLILFSINNRDSFQAVKKTLVDLQRWDDVETKSIIIVANKTDLVRGRCVTRREGRELASANGCKYIETSCTISHQIEDLLQGIGCQILLKEEKQAKESGECIGHGTVDGTTTNGVGALTTSPRNSAIKRKPSFFKRILRRTAMNKSKSCDNLHVL